LLDTAGTLANELLVLIQSLTVLTISLVIIWVKAFNPKGKENIIWVKAFNPKGKEND
jgi:hypothetical protein